MPDLSLEWGGDFEINASGDLLLADGEDYARQAILRRLLTAVKGYVFHQDYGAGLPQRIGRPATALGIQSIVRSQIALESAVDASKPVSIKVDPDLTSAGLFVIAIGYVAADTGQHVELSFTA